MSEEINEKLKKELKLLPKNFVAQIETNSKNYEAVVTASLNFFLQNNSSKGIYITLNKPVSILLHYLEEKKIDTDRLFIIDAITGAAIKKNSGKHNFVVLSGPTALTELSIEIIKEKDTGKFDFIFFDSLSTLLIYNSLNRTMQFSYHLMTKLRDYNLSGMIIYLKSTLEKEVFDSLAHLCDKSLRF